MNLVTCSVVSAAQSAGANALIAKKVIPENLWNTIMTSEDAGAGSLQISTLTPKGLALWQNAYARFNSGA